MSYLDNLELQNNGNETPATLDNVVHELTWIEKHTEKTTDTLDRLVENLELLREQSEYMANKILLIYVYCASILIALIFIFLAVAF